MYFVCEGERGRPALQRHKRMMCVSKHAPPPPPRPRALALRPRCKPANHHTMPHVAALGRRLLRPLCAPLQDDLLYAELTVYETLYFAAMLRLPRSWARADKLARVEMVISGLGIERCRDTIIGGCGGRSCIGVRGSAGEGERGGGRRGGALGLPSLYINGAGCVVLSLRAPAPALPMH